MTDSDNTATLDRLEDDAVLQFLQDQPDFFKRHPSAVNKLDVGHESGAAVSLIERQIASLRERNRRMRVQLDDMISAAHHNQALSEVVHTLARALLGCDCAEDVVAAFESTLLRSARADQVAILLATETVAGQVASGRLRYVARDDASWEPFAAQIGEHRYRCGFATDAQRAILFDDASAVGSMAIAPLHNSDNFIGVLALASLDSTAFTRDMGHLFLQQIAELTSASLSRVR